MIDDFSARQADTLVKAGVTYLLDSTDLIVSIGVHLLFGK
jgi:hypothetical protein